ncbi:putative holin-like toxin [Bacillus subtilis]
MHMTVYESLMIMINFSALMLNAAMFIRVDRK